MNSFSPCFSFFLSWDVSKCLSVWMNRQYQGFSRRPLQTGLTSWGLQAILGTQMEDRDLSVNFPPWFFLSSSGSEMVQYPGSFTLGETVVRVFHIMSFHWAHDFLASIQIPFFFLDLRSVTDFTEQVWPLYMHIYYLWVLHLWMWKQMYLKAFKSHDLGAGWLSSRQKYSLHPMTTSTMGPKHPCAEFCGRSLVWCFMDSLLNLLSLAFSAWN